mmetsp:Transcript_84889/g.221102  ORF Transcript_84889/g.221102 Transcript_84889/m.221102 type:complete len:100 (-) Transcript_84889:169-468(-)
MRVMFVSRRLRARGAETHQDGTAAGKLFGFASRVLCHLAKRSSDLKDVAKTCWPSRKSTMTTRHVTCVVIHERLRIGRSRSCLRASGVSVPRRVGCWQP